VCCACHRYCRVKFCVAQTLAPHTGIYISLIRMRSQSPTIYFACHHCKVKLCVAQTLFAPHTGICTSLTRMQSQPLTMCHQQLLKITCSHATCSVAKCVLRSFFTHMWHPPEPSLAIFIPLPMRRCSKLQRRVCVPAPATWPRALLLFSPPPLHQSSCATLQWMPPSVQAAAMQGHAPMTGNSRIPSSQFRQVCVCACLCVLRDAST
jgi:hypothetical protein